MEPRSSVARHRGFEPLTYGSGAGKKGVAASSNDSQPVGIVRERSSDGVQRSDRFAPVSKDFGAPVVQPSGGLRGRRPGVQDLGEKLLTVREVASKLGVCTAIVYRLVTAGELPHVRVSNAIRIAHVEVEKFVTRSKR
jgi:excisionase family DNA binding protein